MKKILYFFMIACLFMQSCNNFLDVAPKGMVIPQTVEDYSLMLNKTTGGITNTCYMSPEMYLTETAIDTHDEPQMNAYLWNDFQYKLNEGDVNWNDLYARIYVCNEIIEKIDNAESVTLNEVLRRECKGIAHADRARCYFALVNLYAKNYSSSNINELAVPLLLVNDISQKPARSTVSALYEQIVKDLIIAAPLVPKNVKPEEKAKATRAAVYSFLSKVYLFQNQIELAHGAISKAFEETDAKLLNYVDYEIPKGEITDVRRRSTLPRYEHINNDILWAAPVTNNFWFLIAYCSDNLVNQYDKENDLRFYFNVRYMEADNAYLYDNDMARTYAASHAEMYLLKAECLARKGEKEGAVTELNELRKNRFRTGSRYQLDATNKTKDEVIKMVKEERLREFAMTGLHIFDLKRYQSYGEEIDTYRRQYRGEEHVLAPNSNRYVCSIPRFVIGKNDNITQNPR